MTRIKVRSWHAIFSRLLIVKELRAFYPRFVKPFEILEKARATTYRFALPSNLSRNSQPVSYTNVEEAYHGFDSRLDFLRNKSIPLVKVLWNNHYVEEVLRRQTRDVVLYAPLAWKGESGVENHPKHEREDNNDQTTIGNSAASSGKKIDVRRRELEFEVDTLLTH